MTKRATEPQCAALRVKFFLHKAALFPIFCSLLPSSQEPAGGAARRQRPSLPCHAGTASTERGGVQSCWPARSLVPMVLRFFSSDNNSNTRRRSRAEGRSQRRQLREDEAEENKPVAIFLARTAEQPTLWLYTFRSRHRPRSAAQRRVAVVVLVRWLQFHSNRYW